MQVPIFKIFVCWRPKRVPKVLFFWNRENTGPKAYFVALSCPNLGIIVVNAVFS